MVTRPALAGGGGGGVAGPSLQSSAHPVTQLVTLQAFSGEGADGLTVWGREVVYGDLSQRSETGWLWVFSPRQQRHGYVPRDIVVVVDPSDGRATESVARV